MRQKHASWAISARVLQAKRKKDVNWKWEDFGKGSKSDIGWYLQTTYSKINNLIIRNKDSKDIREISQLENDAFENFIHLNHWELLLSKIIIYKEIKIKSIDEFEGFYLLRYGSTLAQAAMRVIKSGKKLNCPD